jgi:hypothetical protein
MIDDWMYVNGFIQNPGIEVKGQTFMNGKDAKYPMEVYLSIIQSFRYFNRNHLSEVPML